MERIVSALVSLNTWKKVGMFSIVIFISVLAYGSYHVIKYTQALEVMVGAKNVTLNPTQQGKVNKIVDNLVDNKGVLEYYVWVFQPDKFIVKHSAELMYGRKRDIPWEVVKGSHWTRTTMDLHELPYVHTTLKVSEIFPITEDDGSYIGTYLKSTNKVYDKVYIQGMYLNNLLVGYCVIFTDKHTDKNYRDDLIKAGRKINNIIFNF